MLETFRKYTGLMFVVLILLFIGLVFFESTGQGVVSGKKVIYAFGRGYTDQELNRLAEKPATMLKDLSGDPFSMRYQAIEPFLSRMGVITHRGVPLDRGQIASFLVNRLSLHKAMEEFGVYASTAEVEQFLKEEVFWSNDRFDEEAYRKFEEDSLGKLGMNVKKMNEVVGEILALRKLQEIVGAGVDASREVVKAQYLNSTQRITYQTVAFPLSDFTEKQQPSEEELKAHWEKNKSKYQSEPKRKIAYILAQPDYAQLEKDLYPETATGDATEAPEESKQPEDATVPPAVEPEQPAEPTDSLESPAPQPQPEDVPEAPEENAEGSADNTVQPQDSTAQPAEETESTQEPAGEPEDTTPPTEEETEQPDATANEPAEAPAPQPAPPPVPAPLPLPLPAPQPGFQELPKGLPAPEPPAGSKLTPEQKKKAVIDLAVKLDNMSDEVDAADGANFEELAAKNGFEIKTTELVTREELPDEINKPLRSEGGGKTGADAIFEHSMGDEPRQAFGEVKKIGEDQWFYFRLLEVEEPRELSFEEAREKVKKDVVAEAAAKEMEETAKEKREALAEAMKGGKSIAEALQELDLTATPANNATRPPGQGPSDAHSQFDLASKTNPGELSEVKVDTKTGDDGSGRAFFVYVEKREVFKNENLDMLIDRQIEQARDRNRTLALANWFAQRGAEADLKWPEEK